MLDTFRDAPLGQLIRLITRNKFLLHPEEREGFQFPKLVTGEPINQTSGETTERAATLDEDAAPLELSMERQMSQEYSRERLEIDEELDLEKTKSRPISLQKSKDGFVLVDWYTTDDPENPQNWSQRKKIFVLTQICFAMYGGSSIYVLGEQGVMDRFNVGNAAAAMGLAIYVIGYGIGPLMFAPLSEIPAIGRNGVYTPTFILFVILSIPTAVVDNYAGLLVLRFLQGLFSSPCLANGGASVGDMFDLLILPLYLSSWTAACFWGPALGPVVAGYAVTAKGFRWSLWELVWMSAPILVVYLIACPETSAETILRRRAQRLRKLTGRTDLRSQSEIKQANMKFSSVFADAIIKPIEIMVKDPAVSFTNVYTALTYGIYYSFFEVFPLVYIDIYHFNLGELGLTFLTIGVACLIGVILFNGYLLLYLVPDIKKRGLRAPEHRLVPALIAVCTLPVGYFLFGWTARHSVHWIVSMIGVVILVVSNFIIFQCIFVYLPLSYPQYAASLFAGNDLFRALFAAGCVIFSRPMFIHLGVGGGVSLLAGLAVVGIAGMVCLYVFGAKLRARSTFAVA
ncbi:hypothetical protein LTR10_021913 [Elasticomyces elasticus]|uniref:Major facilitator superfamily (MFS) profile domain-containing protein n=1 Tax=Exophiala sideris TaxID=1016849 RepID=A0ABR0IWN5_9EURO|nr:hypothetical protein LTR10_021913 [Elasticomyces elasticus]KAK5021855.1 hypothetical protein LTS07_010596 [Exophiala sideris]KAK5025920.1 hypothetical protein LTR13_010233 [Exophiala sideris]KAK5050285.1 hypothetical protein LTR69_010620 [Exophiala sideris]KAK5177110.1 hypothetical protein LTR44_010394 [Eurotiomycetes sp. CCFEE 6388]